MSAMPEYVRRHLVESGVMDADGTTRKARIRFCEQCSAIVVRGLDDDRCARKVSVDPTPLSPGGELEALLLGRRTYTLCLRAGHLLIEWRYAEVIKGKPAGTPPNDAVVEHRCNAPPISGTAPSNLERTVKYPAGQEDACPF